MAYGDIGGPVTELIITCELLDGTSAKKGDPLVLTGDYQVAVPDCINAPIFGQAMADCPYNAIQPHTGRVIPVKVKGVFIFDFNPSNGWWPYVGIVSSADGKVMIPDENDIEAVQNARGIIVKRDVERKQVHVLI